MDVLKLTAYVDTPDVFYRELMEIPADNRLAVFFEYARTVIMAAKAGRITKRRAGAILAPAGRLNLEIDGNVTIALVDAATELEFGVGMSQQWIDRCWDQMVSLLERYY